MAKTYFKIILILLFLLNINNVLIAEDNLSENEIKKIKSQYYETVKHSISPNWEIPPNIPIKAKTIVQITIEKDGSISAVKILENSGYKEYEVAVIKAIKKTILPPLPSVFKSKNKFIILTFQVLI